MRRHLLLALAMAASLALAGNLLAQSTPVQVPPGTPTSTVTGTVVSSSDSELVLDTTGGRQRFVVDANSTLPVKLEAGTRVSVEFHRLDGDRMHVLRRIGKHRHANDRRVLGVIVNNQIQRDSVVPLRERVQRKVLYPHSGMKELRLMTRDAEPSARWGRGSRVADATA